MWSKRKRYIIMVLGVWVAVVAIACGGSATATPIPTPTSPPPTASATSSLPSAQPAPTATPGPVANAGAPAEITFTWEIEEVDAGTKPALALTSDGVPYVAYMLEAMPGFVKSAVRSGTSWDIATVATGYFYGPLDIAIGSDDVAHIAYHDHQDPRNFKPDKGDATYAVLQEGEWSVSAAFDPGHDGWDNRIATDAQGRPHMSAIDPEEFGGDGVEYYHLDDSGDWVVEDIGSGPLTYKYGTSIAIDPQGNPHIAYYDQRDKDLALASRHDSGWTISSVDSDGNTGLFSSLVIDQEGRFHVSYLQQTSSSSGVVKYATKGPAESTWEIRQVDTLDQLVFGFVGARNITSLALDRQVNPWIAYSDEKKLKLAVWDGSAWRIQIVEDAGPKTLGQLVSLKLDSRDHPHIAYFEVVNKGPLTGLVKYAKGTP